MRSASDAVRAATVRLAVVSETTRLDAELLMAHALHVTREALLLGHHHEPAGYAALVERRFVHEPIAYIIGTRGFWTIDLHVTPDVLIPRADSETLIEAAIAHFGTAGPRSVLDLGTGSGALLLAALDQWPQATGVGVDNAHAAVAVARGNARRLGLEARAHIVEGDWGDGGPADLILCNPPYVAAGAALPLDVLREPASALFAGDDGLDDYHRLLPVLPDQLNPGGIVCLEIGPTQAAAVTALARHEGFDVACRRDLGGHDRCLVLQRASDQLGN